METFRPGPLRNLICKIVYLDVGLYIGEVYHFGQLLRVYTDFNRQNLIAQVKEDKFIIDYTNERIA